jgi:16S rRNA (adenine1518-N6/adenine1519-N6)-dimethyltransferase
MLHAKKSLGQNWLKSEAIAKLIVATAELKAGETVLEIGPGTGALTEHLLATGAKVIAIEKDDRAIELLKNKFSQEMNAGNFTLLHGDVLELNTLTNLAEKYKLVANIPYYLTGQILRNFLSNEKQPERMVLMLQNEVAKRIVARDGKESLLSISVKAYGAAKYIKKVPAKYFSPAPKVDSAVLLISEISKNNFVNQTEEEKFFELVKRGFASKRKMLRNHLGVSEEGMKQCKIEPTTRAEELHLDNWLCLANNT